jgi:radical SAM superfamily enzyme YgiQ (UPF0313 family)
LTKDGRTILLINPPWITRDETVWHGIKGAMPPLSLLSIGAVLENEGFNVVVMDAHLKALSEDEVKKEIEAIGPAIVGITMMTATAIVSHRIAQLVKEVDPKTTVVVGGVHPDALPDETLRNRAIDYVVRGDGEYTMLEICQGRPVDEIQGLSHRRDGRPVHNPDRAILMDLNELPPYAYHLIAMGEYYPAAGAYRRLPAINMLMTRGCPGKCIFCNSAETKLRTRDARRVVDEIKHLRDTYGIREIQFYDDTFTVMKKNALHFCELMAEENVGVGFSCFARTDCFSPKMAKALKAAGCHQVMFGVESGSQQILKTLRKDIDLERTRQAVQEAKDAGIEVRAAFVFGTPGETHHTIQETADYAMSLDPDLAIYNITTPYPGTQFYHWAEENDRLKTRDWWDYELGEPIVELGTITGEELKEAYEKAFRKFYNRPRIYAKRLLKIRSITHLRDSVDAFLQVIWKVKMSSRGRYHRGWIRHQREDFFDLDFEESKPPQKHAPGPTRRSLGIVS